MRWKRKYILIFSIYKKLQHELEEKNKNVQNTIKFANDANNSRYQAEKDLEKLKK